jgi:hypothetical protein
MGCPPYGPNGFMTCRAQTQGKKQSPSGFLKNNFQKVVARDQTILRRWKFLGSAWPILSLPPRFALPHPALRATLPAGGEGKTESDRHANDSPSPHRGRAATTRLANCILRLPCRRRYVTHKSRACKRARKDKRIESAANLQRCHCERSFAEFILSEAKDPDKLRDAAISPLNATHRTLARSPRR